MADSVQGEEKQSSCTAWSGKGKALTPSTEISNRLSVSLLHLTSAHTRFWNCLYSPALSPVKASAAPLAHNTGSQGPQMTLQQLLGPRNARQQLVSAHGCHPCSCQPHRAPPAREVLRGATSTSFCPVEEKQQDVCHGLAKSQLHRGTGAGTKPRGA